MHSYKLLTFIGLSVLISACGSTTKSNFSIKTNSETSIISNAETLSIELLNPNNKKFDSIQLTLDTKKITATVDLSAMPLGEKLIKAKVFYDDTFEVALKKVIVVNSEAPKLYTYEIVNTYPHDITSYTQGLEFYNGELYESTGQYGESKLRKLDHKNGTVLKNINLSTAYFGEGLSVLNDKIYQLTWKEGRGLVYDVNSLEQVETFNYGQSKEGWGLCNDGQKFYKSDGSEYLWFLNPTTLAEEGSLQAYTNKGKLTNLNELEWVDGKIYANRYQKNGVAIINPENGAIEAVIDFKALKAKVTKHQGLDVLNGMAYNPKTKTLFVTGKRWDKLFEVKIIKN
ncbi:glutaminyl-peptide cyclotransferase [Flavobacteriaceae bacterium]|jgi:glutamine cyclotransferase|nr:glutaminyl-peptide cyclotransferase [Flavobacteriaceae bacterium]MDA7724205.1 glutaminyl-peptide cyclotransferase [Flavobacteriaceae bacterium]MDA7728070.1 glutaminyl-peptide cyclotransferase [Flavobacteriaceae bacterium]MDG1374763.1 glutaminyl-peptide cyclotransferase [Flavobacteriaceae bacterium]